VGGDEAGKGEAFGFRDDGWPAGCWGALVLMVDLSSRKDSSRILWWKLFHINEEIERCTANIEEANSKLQGLTSAQVREQATALRRRELC